MYEFPVRGVFSGWTSSLYLTRFARQHLLTKDTVHASRWVVENPFTVLSRLTDELRSLKIPQLVRFHSTVSSVRKLLTEGLDLHGRTGQDWLDAGDVRARAFAPASLPRRATCDYKSST